jgi:electron-transferring-flavoprotein dehydrogenase
VIEKASTIGAQILSGRGDRAGAAQRTAARMAQVEPPPICIADVASMNSGLLGADSTQCEAAAGSPADAQHRQRHRLARRACVRWLAPQGGSPRRRVFPASPQAKPVFDDAGAVCGVRIGDMGVARDGSHKPELHPRHRHPRADHRARRGRARQHQQAAHQALHARQTAIRRPTGIGLKELWQVPEGRVTPARQDHAHDGLAAGQRPPTAAASSITWTRTASRSASLPASTTSIPKLMPFELFQQLKHHPLVRPLLEGGQILSAGARSDGGRRLPVLAPGRDAGCHPDRRFRRPLNVPKIKGTHQAMRGGMHGRRTDCRVQQRGRLRRRTAWRRQW